MATLTLNEPTCLSCGHPTSTRCGCRSHREVEHEEETLDLPARNGAWAGKKPAKVRQADLDPATVTLNGTHGEELLDLPKMNWNREATEDVPTANDAGAEVLDLPRMRW